MTKILVVRNDKLGDFVLALPSFAMLKYSIPNAQIHALVPEYTKELAEFCPYIDKVLLDNLSFFRLVKTLQQFDTIIVLFSSSRIAWASWLAQIPIRVAPATKIWQFLFNHRLVQRRSKSLKPEFEYNLDLIRYFLNLKNIKHKFGQAPFIKIPKDKKSPTTVIIHPGSGGSANNLSLSQYAQLADLLKQCQPKLKLVISAGPDELTIANKLSQNITVANQVFLSTKGLVEYCRIINQAYLFIGGSTGALHLAAALNLNTVAFYPNRRSATALRWQTLNSNRLSFSPPQGTDDMKAIDIAKVAQKICQVFLKGDATL